MSEHSRASYAVHKTNEKIVFKLQKLFLQTLGSALAPVINAQVARETHLLAEAQREIPPHLLDTVVCYRSPHTQTNVQVNCPRMPTISLTLNHPPLYEIYLIDVFYDVTTHVLSWKERDVVCQLDKDEELMNASTMWHAASSQLDDWVRSFCKRSKYGGRLQFTDSDLSRIVAMSPAWRANLVNNGSAGWNNLEPAVIRPFKHTPNLPNFQFMSPELAKAVKVAAVLPD